MSKENHEEGFIYKTPTKEKNYRNFSSSRNPHKKGQSSETLHQTVCANLGFDSKNFFEVTEEAKALSEKFWKSYLEVPENRELLKAYNQKRVDLLSQIDPTVTRKTVSMPCQGFVPFNIVGTKRKTRILFALSGKEIDEDLKYSLIANGEKLNKEGKNENFKYEFCPPPSQEFIELLTSKTFELYNESPSKNEELVKAHNIAKVCAELALLRVVIEYLPKYLDRIEFLGSVFNSLPKEHELKFQASLPRKKTKDSLVTQLPEGMLAIKIIPACATCKIRLELYYDIMIDAVNYVPVDRYEAVLSPDKIYLLTSSIKGSPGYKFLDLDEGLSSEPGNIEEFKKPDRKNNIKLPEEGFHKLAEIFSENLKNKNQKNLKRKRYYTPQQVNENENKKCLSGPGKCGLFENTNEPPPKEEKRSYFRNYKNGF